MVSFVLHPDGTTSSLLKLEKSSPEGFKEKKFKFHGYKRFNTGFKICI